MSGFLMTAAVDFLQFTLAHPHHYPRQVKQPLPQGGEVELIDTGVLWFTPDVSSVQRNPSPYALVLSAGIHGNETAPIEWLNQLVSDLLTGRCVLTQPMLCILGNPEAMKRQQRFITHNLNRLFSTQVQQQTDAQDYEILRAQRLMQVVTEFFTHQPYARLHYDLHTAIRESQFEKFALYSRLGHSIPVEQLSLLQQCAVNTVIYHTQATPTFSHFTGEHCGAEGFTLELGAVRPFGQNSPTLLSALDHTLRCLLAGESQVMQAPLDQQAMQLFEVAADITRYSDNFELYVADDVKNFTAYPKGTLLAKDGEYRYRVSHEQEYLIFPNKQVHNGHRAASMLVRL